MIAPVGIRRDDKVPVRVAVSYVGWLSQVGSTAVTVRVAVPYRPIPRVRGKGQHAFETSAIDYGMAHVVLYLDSINATSSMSHFHLALAIWSLDRSPGGSPNCIMEVQIVLHEHGGRCLDLTKCCRAARHDAPTTQVATAILYMHRLALSFARL